MLQGPQKLSFKLSLPVISTIYTTKPKIIKQNNPSVKQCTFKQAVTGFGEEVSFIRFRQILNDL